MNEALGIWLLAATGCRRAEVCTLQWEAVDLEARIFRLRRTKAGKGRVVVRSTRWRRLPEEECPYPPG